MTDTISSESVDAMAKILLESFHAPLQSISNELEKLEQSQLGWLSRIDVENSKFLGNEPELKEAILLLQQVPAYTAKLQAMKKEMAALTAQTQAIAATTTKLKEKKQREIQDRIDKDRMLLAQPAESLAPPPAASVSASSTAKPLNSPL